MKKGQLSIDLMLTGVAALIIISSFLIVATNFAENQKEISIQNQLKIVATQAGTFITSSQALGQPRTENKPINFKAKTILNKIYVDEKQMNADLNFDLANQMLTTIITYNDKNYIQTAFFGYANNIYPFSPFFKAIISYDKTTRTLQVCSDGEGCSQ